MLKQEMELVKLPLKDAFVVKPKHFVDERGDFFKFYTSDFLKSVGFRFNIAEEFLSISKKGILRGLHYQSDPFSQAKLVTCTRGAILDVIVDMRQSSPTFGKWTAIELTEQNRNTLYVPRGFAHGFLSLEENSEVFYKGDNDYSVPHECGVKWNDSFLNIKWPQMDNYIVSSKDESWPNFQDAKKFK